MKRFFLFSRNLDLPMSNLVVAELMAMFDADLGDVFMLYVCRLVDLYVS